MRIVECPKCGEDISDTYQRAEPDVGLFGSGWYCEACDFIVDDNDDDFEPVDEPDDRIKGIGR